MEQQQLIMLFSEASHGSRLSASGDSSMRLIAVNGLLNPVSSTVENVLELRHVFSATSG